MNGEGYTASFPEDDRKIGSALKSARTDRGLSLDEVEQATKIRKRYLEGLEREDHSILPDAVYVQGFLKTYANYLGLNGDEISREFRSSRRPPRERQHNYLSRRSDYEQPLINPRGVRGTRRRRVSSGTILTIVVAVLVLALVIGGLYYIGRGSQAYTEADPSEPAQTPPRGDSGQEEASPSGPSDQGSNPDAEPGAEPTGEPVPETTSEAASPETLRVEFQVRGRPSWLEIRADGDTSFAEIAEPGFSKTFEAKRRLSVTTGDAGAVRVAVNGQDVGVLGESGQVLTRDWTLKTGG